MARPLRLEFPGALYHVTSRMLGSWRQTRDRLFRDERDHLRFLERLGEGVSDFGIRLYLFTLMRNHLASAPGDAGRESLPIHAAPFHGLDGVF